MHDASADNGRGAAYPAESSSGAGRSTPGNAAAGHSGSGARGKWTIAAIFLLGGAVTAGLFLAPRARAPTAPANVQYGAPPRDLRVVLYDLTAAPREASAAAAAIRAVVPDPDFVLLTGVTASEVPAIARGLGMDASYHPQLFQRVRANSTAGERGACVLSKHPLYEGHFLGTSKKEALGVAAMAVVDGRMFQVACALVREGDGSGASGDEVVERLFPTLDRPPAIIGTLPAGQRGASPGNGAMGITATEDWTQGPSAVDPIRRWAWTTVSHRPKPGDSPSPSPTRSH